VSEIIDKATRCHRLLQDDDLTEAFQGVRDALFRKFEETSVSDGDTLLDIRKMLHLLDSVRANLEAAVEAGKIEEYELEQGKVSFLGDKKWLKALSR